MLVGIIEKTQRTRVVTDMIVAHVMIVAHDMFVAHVMFVAGFFTDTPHTTPS